MNTWFPKIKLQVKTMRCAVEGIYRNGVVKLLEDVPVHKTMKVIAVFKEEFNEGYANKDWLKLSETAFEFWDNEEGAYYDDL
jgi:predicted DNA-binding antitoxin AbrB/MazE fold protein